MEESSHQQALADTIGHLAARWARADKQILRHVFPLLAEGQPVTLARISEAAGSPPAMVEAALELGRAERDAEGRVMELSGLMLSPTMHRVEIGDVALFSCCALLAQLAPMLVGRSVKVESIDPMSRRVVRLVITPQGVAAVEPSEAVASFVVTEPAGMAEDVSATFCRHVHHFASSESAATFVAADRRRYPLEIGELNEAAEMLYRKAWMR
ncbi:MAG: hypothetical protein JSU87_15485 [Gemmatimonadota bacterium]|nr:MAG: hypothetical protein JSU87_15485 [Gemmatimonadota bacterium]